MSVAALHPETTLLLLRHAHSLSAGRFCGSLDTDLSPRGRADLPSISAFLGRWSVSQVFTSPLRRARDTAIAIAHARALPIQIRPHAAEIGFGRWEGLTWDEIQAADPAFAAEWMTRYPRLSPPGGEPFADFRSRVEKELLDLAAFAKGEFAVLVSHSGFIRTAVAILLGIPDRNLGTLRLDYGALTELNYVQNVWSVSRFNVPFR